MATKVKLSIFVLSPWLAEKLQISQEDLTHFFKEHLQKLQKAIISFIMYVCIEQSKWHMIDF